MKKRTIHDKKKHLQSIVHHPEFQFRQLRKSIGSMNRCTRVLLTYDCFRYSPGVRPRYLR